MDDIMPTLPVAHKLKICQEIDDLLAQGITITEACGVVRKKHQKKYGLIREIYRTKDICLRIQKFMNDDGAKKYVLDRYVAGETFEDVSKDIGIPAIWLSRGFFCELEDAEQYRRARQDTMRHHKKLTIEPSAPEYDFSGDNLDLPAKTRCNQVCHTSARVGNSSLQTAEA
jgi:hypothetical protein